MRSARLLTVSFLTAALLLVAGLTAHAEDAPTDVAKSAGNPRVQVHGPGFSKIVFGDDRVDDWERYLDMMVDSVFLNSGRGCINCSGIWVSRHSRDTPPSRHHQERRRASADS